jgi:hypothetical protein
MYEPQVFARREQFSCALTGFVSCVGISLLAKMPVVRKIKVMQNRPLLTSSMQQALFKGNAERAVEEELQLLVLSSAS